MDGAFVRARREQLGLSLRALGEIANLSAGYLCDLERGFRNAKPSTRARLAMALKVEAVTA